MKIQVKEFVKKKIEVLVKRDIQEWPPACTGWVVPTATSPCI